jgi:hypothetical protein
MIKDASKNMLLDDGFYAHKNASAKKRKPLLVFEEREGGDRRGNKFSPRFLIGFSSTA